MTWEDTLKAKRSLQKVPLAGSPIRGTHGYGDSQSRGSKRQQENRHILGSELRAIEGDDTPWTLLLFTYHDAGLDEFDEEELEFNGSLDEAKNWAEQQWDKYNVIAETHPEYGGSGFTLFDVNDNKVHSDKDV